MLRKHRTKSLDTKFNGFSAHETATVTTNTANKLWNCPNSLWSYKLRRGKCCAWCFLRVTDECPRSIPPICTEIFLLMHQVARSLHSDRLRDVVKSMYGIISRRRYYDRWQHDTDVTIITFSCNTSGEVKFQMKNKQKRRSHDDLRWPYQNTSHITRYFIEQSNVNKFWSSSTMVTNNSHQL